MNFRLFPRLCILTSILCLSIFLLQAEAAAPAKYRVAVGDIIVSDGVSKRMTELVKKSSLIADIENSIRNSRKFDVLTRRASHMAAIRKEQQFAESDLAAGDAAETGMLQNAQAIINVEVLNFSFGRNARPVPNMDNKWHINDYCSMELSVQILDTKTGRINASFPIKVSSGSGSYMANSRGGSSPAIMNRTLEKGAAMLTNKLSDTIFPILIIKVDGNQIWVNRGDDAAMKMGQIFDIFEPGEELIDPTTGENLGSIETPVGKAKVVRINPKVTLMKIIKGDSARIQSLFILRRPISKK